MKKFLIILGFLIAAVVIVRTITSEDTWICQNGQWVKHGNPSSVQPTSYCEAKKSESDKIKKFSSAAELQVFLEENQNAESEGYGGGGAAMRGDVVFSQEKSLSLPNAAKETAPESAGMGPDYSKTNVQVEGVDEADIVKTDGRYIYAVSGKNLFIVQAAPAENSKIISKIEFKSTPQEMYLNGNRLIVYGYNEQIFEQSFYKKFKRQNPYAFFKIFDVSDPRAPRQIKDLDFEGSVVSSRMIGDFVYLITSYYQGIFAVESPLPRILEKGESIADEKNTEVYYFDLPYDTFNFTTVSSVNVAQVNAKIKNNVYLLPSAQNVYASPQNLYIAYTRYVSEDELSAEVLKEILFPKLSESEKERIAEIEKTKNFVLSRREKLQKINQLLQLHLTGLPESEQEDLQDKVEEAMKQKYKDLSKELEKTVIHKIAIKNSELDYQDFGEVTGSVLNQFSMDENDGYFRIATTKNRTWSRFEGGTESNESYNNLYVLDRAMKVVGRLEDLATSERIYSVRFMQGRAYMVTFRQTDPLFVIDLKDPTAPKVLGKLKVPGFSQYLHPYDENTLIGFAKDADERGRVKSLKLSLFDVSNIDNLKEIDTVTLGESGSNSIALNDHKAFLFSKEKELLVIPVEIREGGDDDVIIMRESAPCLGGKCIIPLPRYQYFRGATVYKVTKSGFELKGKIDHANSSEASSGDWYGYGAYNTTVKRSLYIGDVLYTMSDKYVKANKIYDLEEVKSLKLQFPEEKEEDFKVVN